jgi:hypothetical protein
MTNPKCDVKTIFVAFRESPTAGKNMSILEETSSLDEDERRCRFRLHQFHRRRVYSWLITIGVHGNVLSELRRSELSITRVSGLGPPHIVLAFLQGRMPTYKSMTDHCGRDRFIQLQSQRRLRTLSR